MSDSKRALAIARLPNKWRRCLAKLAFPTPVSSHPARLQVHVMPAGRDVGGVGLRVKVAALALPALCGAVPAALVVVAAALVGASVGLVERLGLELELEGLGLELGLGLRSR